MNTSGKLEKPRVPKRFYLITTLIYLPVIYSLSVISAHWYGFLIVAISFSALMWIRHSKAWRGWYVPLCFTCALVTALFGLYFSRPRWDVSLPGQIGSGTIRVFTHLPMNEKAKSSDSIAEILAWEPPEGYSLTTIQLPTCPMEQFSRDNSQSDWAVLQLHGGAFVSGHNDLYRAMAQRYCDMADGANVYTPDYRLSPAAAYPAQQNDAMSAWLYLTQTLGYRPDHVILAGDSAGGNLALSLPLRLREEGLQLPAAIVAMSPWADLSNSGASHLEKATDDPTFGIDKKAFDGVTPVGVPSTYAEGLDAQNPYLSPSFGDYYGFPPMLLQAGDMEVLLSDSEMVYENAVANGVDCTLTVYPGMFHVFQGSLDLLPESRTAWKEIGAFIKRVME